MRTFVLLAILNVLMNSAVFAAGPVSSVDTGRVTVGKNLALNQCTACHIVAADQQFSVVSRLPGPAFQAIADNPKATPDYLNHFLTTTHMSITSYMPNPELTKDEVADVVSFILSLRSKH